MSGNFLEYFCYGALCGVGLLSFAVFVLWLMVWASERQEKKKRGNEDVSA